MNPFFHIALWALLVFAGHAHAFRLLPYRVTLQNPDGSFDKYHAIVSIPEAMVGVVPIQDDLSSALAKFPGTPDRAQFHQRLTERAFAWYLERLRKETNLYGKDAGAIAAEIESASTPIELENSSLVLLMQPGLDLKLVAFLRVSYADKQGLLGADKKRKFKEAKRIPITGRMTFPRYRVNEAGVVDLFAKDASEFLTVKKGARVELKHFSFIPHGLAKFFPALYQIARVHRLFAVAPGADGQSLWGVDEVVLDCFKQNARDFYLGLTFTQQEQQLVVLPNGNTVDYFIMNGILKLVDDQVFEVNEKLRRQRKIFISLDDKVFENCRQQLVEGVHQ